MSGVTWASSDSGDSDASDETLALADEVLESTQE